MRFKPLKRRRFLDSSHLTFKFGPDYRRYDVNGLSGINAGYFSTGGLNLQLHFDYYFWQWLNITASYSYSRFTLKRYDGIAVDPQKQKENELQFKINFSVHNFYFGYVYGMEKEARLNIEGPSIEIRRIKMSGHGFYVGYRVYLWKPVALDFGYSYRELTAQETPLENFKGSENKFGFKLFWNFRERSQIGVEFTETILKTSWDGGSERNKIFLALPYYTF